MESKNNSQEKFKKIYFKLHETKIQLIKSVGGSKGNAQKEIHTIEQTHWEKERSMIKYKHLP